MGASIADTELDDDSDFAETHEINVTPFIDVILVLLIIFMVAAPLSTVDLPIDLPTSTATPQKKPDKPTYVSIKPDLAVAIGETPVKRVDLVRSLDEMADSSKDRFIFLRADRAVPYGELMDVLEILRAGGYSKIKLVALEGVPETTEPPKDVPTEADDPDRVVTPNDSNKPKDEDSKIAAVQTNASTESVAAEATATPSSEAIRKGPRSVAPAQGTGESARRARVTWQKALMAHLEKHKRHPAERTLNGAEIPAGFALDPMGHVLSTSIVKGSRDRAFDESALAT